MSKDWNNNEHYKYYKQKYHLVGNNPGLNNSFHTLIMEGILVGMKAALDAGANPNSVDTYRKLKGPALHYLVLSNAKTLPETVEMIVSHGGNIDVLCDGITPFARACQEFRSSNLQKNKNYAKILFLNGADITLVSQEDLPEVFVSLPLAIHEGEDEIVKYLVKKGVDFTNINFLNLHDQFLDLYNIAELADCIFKGKEIQDNSNINRSLLDVFSARLKYKLLNDKLIYTDLANYSKHVNKLYLTMLPSELLKAINNVIEPILNSKATLAICEGDFLFHLTGLTPSPVGLVNLHFNTNSVVRNSMEIERENFFNEHPDLVGVGNYLASVFSEHFVECVKLIKENELLRVQINNILKEGNISDKLKLTLHTALQKSLLPLDDNFFIEVKIDLIGSTNMVLDQETNLIGSTDMSSDTDDTNPCDIM